jgi:peptidoglycan/LPS O-acetylase OafA/YrhL
MTKSIEPPEMEIMRRRIPSISSVRFVLAMWVVLGHFGLPFLREPQHAPMLWILRGLLNNAFNGPAAVIVFFVISGFCIHFPNRRNAKIHSWKAYYLRRYIRILIPMMIAIVLSHPLGMQFGLFTSSILWSLLCEEIYYFLYPALMAIRNRTGWSSLMAMAGLFAFLTVLTDTHAKDYASYGSSLNWVVGLPCWLLGCIMAERFEIFRFLPTNGVQLWLWRGGIWALSAVLSVLRFHTSIGYPWTLDLFAIIAVLWLEREVRFYYVRGKPVLENLGEASYSIYLTHTHGPAFLSMLALSLSPISMWLWSLILCGALASAFYWLVERPSHLLARRIGAERRSAQIAAVVTAG